jgi:proteasome accessory factor B
MSRAGRKAGRYTQSHRLLRLLTHLRCHHYGVGHAELAERFSITERQLRRDLAVLEEAGHRLERGLADDGRARVRLADTRPRAVALTRRERYALLAMRRVFDVLEGTPLAEDVASIYRKIAGSLPEADRAELAGMGERFVFLPEGGAKSYRRKGDVLDGLLTGTLDRLRVRFRYRGPESEVTAGLLEPYAMVLYKQGLYVVGAVADGPARGRPLVWAAERFEAAEHVRGARFDVPRGFSADRFFDGAFGVFVGREAHAVAIDFDAAVRAHVLARRWHRTQRVTPLRGGGVRLELRVSSLAQVVPWVLSWGPHARARRPAELVERIRDELAGLRARYRPRARRRRPA